MFYRGLIKILTTFIFFPELLHILASFSPKSLISVDAVVSSTFGGENVAGGVEDGGGGINSSAI